MNKILQFCKGRFKFGTSDVRSDKNSFLSKLIYFNSFQKIWNEVDADSCKYQLETLNIFNRQLFILCSGTPYKYLPQHTQNNTSQILKVLLKMCFHIYTPCAFFLTVRFQISVKKKAPCQKKGTASKKRHFWNKISNFCQKKGIFGTKFVISVKKKAPCQKKGTVSKKRH